MCLFQFRVSRQKEKLSEEKILVDKNPGDDERDKLLHLTQTHRLSTNTHTLPSIIPVPVGILRHALFQKSISTSSTARENIKLKTNRKKSSVSSLESRLKPSYCTRQRTDGYIFSPQHKSKYISVSGEFKCQARHQVKETPLGSISICGVKGVFCIPHF